MTTTACQRSPIVGWMIGGTLVSPTYAAWLYSICGSQYLATSCDSALIQDCAPSVVGASLSVRTRPVD